jgi:hypothetical protein
MQLINLECDPGQWGFDCAERCNCGRKNFAKHELMQINSSAGNLPCDFGNGQCPGGKCAPGKQNSIYFYFLS